MRRHLIATFASLAALAAGCGPAATPSICAVAPDELVLFPDALGGVPTNAVVRMLTGGYADDLHLVVVEAGATVSEPGAEVLLDTTFGDVLEFTPDLELLPNQDYDVDVVDDRGVVLASTGFSTSTRRESGPVLAASGPATLTPIAGPDRACCSAGGCVDGTVLSLPPLAADNFAPQLVLVEVAELYNDACGATSRPAGIIPVVWDGRTDLALEAETDLRLRGCYEITLITQTLGEATPAAMVCAPGATFAPAAPTADCQPVAGCACGAAATPLDAAGSLSLALAVLALLGARRRRLATREETP